MTAKQFYDWQTSGGTDDVMRIVDCLERVDVERQRGQVWKASRMLTS